MTSQMVIFRAFFFVPDPKSDFFFPVNQLIKKFLPYKWLLMEKYGKS